MGQPQSRLTDLTLHAPPVISGSPDTIVGGLLAARVGDLTSPCPVCLTPPPGKIVSGSSSVFINSVAAARITDAVACGAGSVPPGGGSHGPVSIYAVKPEDNYVDAMFRDDSFLSSEAAGDMKGPPPPDVQPPRKPATFLSALSLDIDLGRRSGSAGAGGGPNALALGDFTVIVGG
jgi:uncharacterized Zn-binding protein involved in type VI secretion